MSEITKLPAEPVVIGARVNKASPKGGTNPTVCPVSPGPLTIPSPTASILSFDDASTEEFDPHIGAKPYSPFYRHDATSSLEYLKNERSGSQDLESQPTHKRSDEIHNLQRSKLWATKEKKLDFLARLPKRNRFAVKLLIAVITLGGMIGIAFGISSAVGVNNIKVYQEQQENSR
ncbi:hypothetical protein VTN49DRAFT_3113 [Thermomyces lanuginosus]|uniref:uncharacterized protein n=1 Tax=Thermomyces lanuginosus TaxID=5541 RepID=UPI003742EE8A